MAGNPPDRIAPWGLITTVLLLVLHLMTKWTLSRSSDNSWTHRSTGSRKLSDYSPHNCWYRKTIMFSYPWRQIRADSGTDLRPQPSIIDRKCHLISQTKLSLLLLANRVRVFYKRWTSRNFRFQTFSLFRITTRPEIDHISPSPLPFITLSPGVPFLNFCTSPHPEIVRSRRSHIQLGVN